MMRWKKQWVAWTLACGLSAVGCNEDFALGVSEWKDTFQQSASLTVDILFVVDNSLSMSQEQARVIQAFNDFIANIQESNTDFHLGVTTTDMNEEGEQGRLVPYESVRYITSDMAPESYEPLFTGMISSLGTGSGWEKGLWAAKSALYPVDQDGQSGPGGYNDGFLRSDAKLAIIFVSDEDDCSDEGDPLDGDNDELCYTAKPELRPVYEYVADFQRLKSKDEDVVISAIVGQYGVEPQSECDLTSTPGERYLELTSNFDGSVGDICESDFSKLLSQMGLAASGIRTHFVLSRTPDVETIKVLINEVEMPASEGWSYDPETNAIDFVGQAIPPRDSTLVITYELG